MGAEPSVCVSWVSSSDLVISLLTIVMMKFAIELLCVKKLEKLSLHEVDGINGQRVTDYALQDLENSLHSYISGSTISPYSISNVRSASQESKTDHGISKSLAKAGYDNNFQKMSRLYWSNPTCYRILYFLHMVQFLRFVL